MRRCCLGPALGQTIKVERKGIYCYKSGARNRTAKLPQPKGGEATWLLIPNVVPLQIPGEFQDTNCLKPFFCFYISFETVGQIDGRTTCSQFLDIITPFSLHVSQTVFCGLFGPCPMPSPSFILQPPPLASPKHFPTSLPSGAMGNGRGSPGSASPAA